MHCGVGHLEGRHCHVVRILLLVAQLESLLEDVLVTDHAHVRILGLVLVIC